MRNPVRPGARRAFTAGQIRVAYANATLLAVWLDRAAWLTRDPSFGNLTPPDRRDRIASGYEGLIRDFLKAKAAFDCEDLYRLAERLYPLGQRLIVAGRPYACMIEGLATEVERALRHAIPVDAMPPREWRYREHLSDQSREDWLRQWPEVQEESWQCLMTELRTIVTPELRCDLGREERRLVDSLPACQEAPSPEDQPKQRKPPREAFRCWFFHRCKGMKQAEIAAAMGWGRGGQSKVSRYCEAAEKYLTVLKAISPAASPGDRVRIIDAQAIARFADDCEERDQEE